MQEKSSNCATKQRTSALDSFADYLWKHCDSVVAIGVALVVMMLFKLACVISLLQ